MQRFRGGLVFKTHRLLYHSTLGLRVIKKRFQGLGFRGELFGVSNSEGSYLRLIDFVYHSTLGLRVIKKKKVSNSGAG